MRCAIAATSPERRASPLDRAFGASATPIQPGVQKTTNIGHSCADSRSRHAAKPRGSMPRPSGGCQEPRDAAASLGMLPQVWGCCRASGDAAARGAMLAQSSQGPRNSGHASERRGRPASSWPCSEEIATADASWSGSKSGQDLTASLPDPIASDAQPSGPDLTYPLSILDLTYPACQTSRPRDLSTSLASLS